MVCPICDRLLGTVNIDKHHLIPKTFGGKSTVLVHKICHRKVHATFTERELFHVYNTVEALRSHEEIRKFVNWVRRKDPSFYDGSKNSSRKRR